MNIGLPAPRVPGMKHAMSEIRHPFPDAPAAGSATEVAPGVLWMRLSLPWALDHVNVYAIDEGDGWTLIDTGISSRRALAAWQDLLAGPLAGRPVKRLIVTHHHPDHIGMAGWFIEQGAALLITRTAWLYARMLFNTAEDRPAAETVTFWKRAGMLPADLERRMNERPFNASDCMAPLPLGFTRISEGQTLRLGGRDWQIRIGHGHAPAHATLWTDGLVLGGDQLLPGISANIGVYPAEPEADPLGNGWKAAPGSAFSRARINWCCRAISFLSPACRSGCARWWKTISRPWTGCAISSPCPIRRWVASRCCSAAGSAKASLATLWLRRWRI